MGGGNGPLFSIDDLEADFDRYVLDRFFQMNSSISHLAHYTNLDTAVNIITNRQFWMSNINQMNDAEEFIKGKQLTIENFYRRVSDMSDFETLPQKIINIFQDIFKTIEKQLFCLSFSQFSFEKDPPDSLEMWDRYGSRGEGLCLVFASERLLLKQQTKDPIFWLPMIYQNKTEFVSDFDKIFDDVLFWICELDDDEDDIAQAVASIFVVYAMLFKNNGFIGECEIRLVHSPVIHIQKCSSISLENRKIRNSEREMAIVNTNSYVSRNGIKINFENTLDSVIVGPSCHDDVCILIRNTLDAHNLNNTKVIKSTIPYR